MSEKNRLNWVQLLLVALAAAAPGLLEHFVINKQSNNLELHKHLLKLIPKVEDNFSLKGFQINKNEIQLFLENNTNSKIYIRLYDKKNGNLLSEIEVK